VEEEADISVRRVIVVSTKPRRSRNDKKRPRITFRYFDHGNAAGLPWSDEKDIKKDHHTQRNACAPIGIAKNGGALVSRQKKRNAETASYQHFSQPD
jgi:hypothetical protein